MISIAQVVEDLCITTPYLGEAIRSGLVNYSGFARLYKKEIERRTMKPVTVGAIVMALRRLEKKRLNHKNTATVFNEQPDLIVRSNLFEMTVSNNPELAVQQKKLLTYASTLPNTLLTVTHGVFETTIIASQHVMGKIKPLYPESAIVSTEYNLSAITIKFPKEIIDTPGIIYTILNTVAWNGVSLVEIVSTYSEFTLIIENKDVDTVFGLIQKLFSHQQAHENQLLHR